MQNSDEQFLVNQTGTPGTAVDFSKYQDLSANSFEGLYGTYPPKGYFRLWPINMTYAEAQDDLSAMGCSQGIDCTICPSQDPNYKSCFGCGCRSQIQIEADGYQTTWFHPDFTNNIAVVVLLVNDGRIILLRMLFEIDKPMLGWGWSPSYKVGSIKKISVANFGIVYLLTFLFMLFSFKQMKDQKWDYLTSIWNWFDVINLSLFIASFYQSLVFMGGYSDTTGTHSDSIDATTMYSLLMLSKAQSSIMILYGVNMLIMNLKLIKYIQALDFIPGLAMPIAALQEAGIEMFAFMFTLIITCLGFAQTFTAWFGDEVLNYNTSKDSFITMLLALTGYPAFNDLGQGKHSQDSMQSIGIVVLCLYCYFFIFFFLVMLVAIQMVAYNKVRHQFLVAGKRFLTLRQFCKLMMKQYRLAKIEVEETHGGSWAKFFKLQLDDYYKENFADLSNNDVGDDNAGNNAEDRKIPLYESTRLSQETHSLRLLDDMTDMFSRLDHVLDKVSQQDDKIDNTIDDNAAKSSCFGLCKGKQKDNGDDEQLETDPAEQQEEEYQTGEQVAMAKGRADLALETLEDLEKKVQQIVFKQQEQQSFILKSCDDIMTWTAALQQAQLNKSKH